MDIMNRQPVGYITEPELCDDAGFYALHQLPEKMIPQARDALQHVLTGPAIVMSNYDSLLKRLEEQHSECT